MANPFGHSRRERKKNQNRIAGNRNRFNQLHNSILGEDSIDERTRADLLENFKIGGKLDNKLASGSNGEEIGALDDFFVKAKEGQLAKFKARQFVQQQYNFQVGQADNQRLRGAVLSFGSKVRK